MFKNTQTFTHDQPVTSAPWPRSSRQIRGRLAYQSGLAAEESVERRYVEVGASVIGRRVRTPFGELDLVLKQNAMLIFVEVKARRRAVDMERPISSKQWQRLKNAVLHYMFSAYSETGVQHACRFDVALVDHIGTVTVHENACSFDEQ